MKRPGSGCDSTARVAVGRPKTAFPASCLARPRERAFQGRARRGSAVAAERSGAALMTAKAYRLLRAVLMTAVEEDKICRRIRAASAVPVTRTQQSGRSWPSSRSSHSRSESASPAGPGGVGRPVPDSAGRGRAAIAAHEPMIIFGTYLAQPAAHAHPAPCATASDTISPRPRSRWSGLFRVVVAGVGLEPTQAEPTVQDTAHLQRPGDLRVPVMTCDFSWWQVLGSNQRRLSRRFYRPLPLATRATCLSRPPKTAR